MCCALSVLINFLVLAVPVEHKEAKGVAVSPEFDLSEEARVEWRQHSIPSLHFDTTAEETGSPLSAIQ